MKHLVVLLSLLPFAAAAAPKAELWEAWVPANEASRTQVDHSPWDRLLERYLGTGDPSEVYLFSYSRVSGEDRALLEQYLERLQAVRVKELNRSEQMAFLLNLYNALTVKVVLDHWPVASIRDIRLRGGGPLGRGPWDAPLAEIQGRPVTLNDMEHGILRPIWKDSRIHYAVNCATIGCPNLQPVAFTAENLPVLLERAAVMYVNDPPAPRSRTAPCGCPASTTGSRGTSAIRPRRSCGTSIATPMPCFAGPWSRSSTGGAGCATATTGASTPPTEAAFG